MLPHLPPKLSSRNSVVKEPEKVYYLFKVSTCMTWLICSISQMDLLWSAPTLFNLFSLVKCLKTLSKGEREYSEDYPGHGSYWDVVDVLSSSLNVCWCWDAEMKCYNKIIPLEKHDEWYSDKSLEDTADSGTLASHNLFWT